MPSTAFSPIGNTVSVTTVIGSTPATAIPGDPSGSGTAMVYNSGGTDIFIRFGDVNVIDALTTDIVLPKNSNLPFSIPQGITHFKVYSTAAGALVYVQRGGGM